MDAGIRIDPEGYCRSRMSYYTGLAIGRFDDELTLPMAVGHAMPITGIPADHGINEVSWSRNGKHVAFAARHLGTEMDPKRPPASLWLADVATGKARCLLERPLNSVFEDYVWVSDECIIAAVIPSTSEAPPLERSLMPLGPRIDDNTDGRRSQTRTFQDLLKDSHDESLFDHYCTAELVSLNVASGEITTLGEPRVYTAVSPSPDGRYLLVAWLERPYSYAVPCGRFAKRVQLWDNIGNFIREIATLPLALDIPLAFDSCRAGPRSIGWRDDKPAELIWAEAQDGGDPANDVSPRDVVFSLAADEASDHTARPKRIAATHMRYGGITWGHDELALLYESEWKTRRSRVWTFAPGNSSAEPQVLFDRNYEDSYSDPGSPMLRRTAMGRYVLAEVDAPGRLLLQGAGASPEGNKPFIDVLDLQTREKRRIWQSRPPFYEFASSILNDTDTDSALPSVSQVILPLHGLRMLARRETVEEPPQYHILTFTNAEENLIFSYRQISEFPHPYPSLRGLQKEVLRYQREDGVSLNGTLYFPPGYDQERDGQLPALLWAYPREFKSKDAAGQLRRSPHQFDPIGSTSPLLFLTQGIAVLDGPSFPIVAEGEAEPNDTYVEQLTASARAALQELERHGAIDIQKVAVGGHSYGAFMAAGLLAHAPDLFACGIARSGAYNRTMTPFGFQSEERTLWQAPETYSKMSPFNHADKIQRPLLLIHGEADNNPGTFTLQSERLYAALKGHGVVSRLVVLPYESHSYAAKESVLHVLAETQDWLQRYCVNGKALEASKNNDVQM